MCISKEKHILYFLIGLFLGFSPGLVVNLYRSNCNLKSHVRNTGLYEPVTEDVIRNNLYENMTYLSELKNCTDKLNTECLLQRSEAYQREIQEMNNIVSKKNLPIEMITKNANRYPENFWTNFNSKGFFSHNDFQPKEIRRLFIRHRHRILRYYLRRVFQKYNYTFDGHKDILYRLKYGYTTVNPRRGVAYVMKLHAKKGNKWYKKQYILQRTFSKLQWKEETAYGKSKNVSQIRVNFIVPISGKHATFFMFLKQWENDILSKDENVSLTFVVTEDKQNKGQYQLVQDTVEKLKRKYQTQKFYAIHSMHSFQRAYSLQKGAEIFNQDSLLFFIDIDCFITRNTLHEIRANTIREKQVYFPIVFSLYNPKYIWYNNSLQLPDNKHEFSYSKGYWRWYGYGMTGIYKSDYSKVGGLNIRIKGWGSEDTSFAERFIRKRIKIFRAPTLGLKHIYHPKICRKNLHEKYSTCKTVKWRSEFSEQILTAIIYDKFYNSTF